MARVLVPLDGSDLAASILPDALRLAGPNGELILVRDAAHPMYDRDIGERSQRFALEHAQEYLEAEAAELRRHGARAEVHALMMTDAAMAIGEAAHLFEADMIAAATHGHGPLGRLIHGGVAWRALAQSPVPVLVRHPEACPDAAPVPFGARRILVPLDGSMYAEKALPLARRLAQEWQAAIWLVRCVPAVTVPETLFTYSDGFYPPDQREDVLNAREYLNAVAGTLPGEVHSHVYFGQVGPTLAMLAQEWCITDVVMASHGRTGLARVILGSVADDLIQHLHCPILVIPAHAAAAIAIEDRSSDKVVALTAHRAGKELAGTR